MQDRALEDVYRQSVLFRTRFASAIRAATLDALRRNGQMLLSPKLDDAFLDLSALAWIKGVESERSRKKVIILGPSKVAKKIARSFDIDLGKVKNKLRTRTGRDLRRSVDPLEKRLNNLLAESSERGFGLKRARKEILKGLDRMGVSVVNPSYIDTLVRTHTQITYSSARWETTQIDDSVWGYKYINTGTNIRPEHAALNGTTRKKDDAIWGLIWPPNGWNCKCQTVTLYEKERQTRVPKNPDIASGFETNFGIELNTRELVR